LTTFVYFILYIVFEYTTGMPHFKVHHGHFVSLQIWDSEYRQYQQQTNIPYSEGPMLHSFKILMLSNQITSNTTSNQTPATCRCGSVWVMFPQK